MPGTILDVADFQLGREPAAQLMRGAGLAHAADVILRAFDSQQRRVPDHRRIDAAAAPHQISQRQIVLHEYRLHRLQIELGREICHGEIFVVEILDRMHLLELAIDHVSMQLAERILVPVEIHADEAGQLQEARIDLAPTAGITQRHFANDVALEPAQRVFLGERVDLGRIDPRVDRPGHQGQAARCGRMAVLGHDRDRRERSDAGLTDRNDVRARPHHGDEVDQMRDVVVEIELAIRQRNVAGIVPVGDIDIVLG